MPTINAYKHDPGYYIRAWTSDLGNINYKLRSRGNTIIERFGLEDSDEISWDTIHALKSIGEIYTEGSGTLGRDDFAPLDGDTKTLSEEEAKRLLDSILDEKNPSEQRIEELCDILDIDRPESNIERLEQELASRLAGITSRESFQTEVTLNGPADQASISVNIEPSEESTDPPLDSTINLLLLGDTSLDDPGIARHDIYLCEEHGLEGWSFAYSGSWETHAEMARQKAELMPIVIQWFDDLNIDYGIPKESFGGAQRDLLG